MNALQTVLDALEGHDAGVRAQGGYYTARCPTHDDHNPSLTVAHLDGKAGDRGGRVRVRCHAGCDELGVLAAIGLGLRDLYDDPIPNGRGVVREHPYVAGNGALLGVVQRREPKTFRPLTPKPGGGWQQKATDDLKATPYRLPEVVAAVADGRPVWVAEGEHDADRLARENITATCNAGGAGKWSERHAAWLLGADVVVCRHRDPAGEKHADQVVTSLAGIAASVRLVEPATGNDMAEHLDAGRVLDEVTEVDLPAAPLPVSRAQLVRLADVVSERVTWLWPGRLPAGKLVVLDGDPSLGKSTVALTFAAHLSVGRVWPDGTPCPQADTVLLSAEDGLADTVRPRLDAAGGDPTRVHALTEVADLDEDTGERFLRSPTLRDVGPITDAVESTGARLLIIDVLMAYLGGKTDSHRDQDIRAVLHPIAALADRTGCTVLILRHLNKTTGGSALYRGGGSIGIVGACRAGYIVAPDPDDEGRRILACSKMNLAEEPPSLSYVLESAPGSHVARVAWGEASPHSAADLLRPVDDDEHDERDEVKKWLFAHLADGGGTAAARDVYRAASKAGYSKDQVKRAKKSLGIKAEKVGMDGGWNWTDPEKSNTEGSTEGSEESGSQNPAPFHPFALPSATPDPEPSPDDALLPADLNGTTCRVCGAHSTYLDAGVCRRQTCIDTRRRSA